MDIVKLQEEYQLYVPKATRLQTEFTKQLNHLISNSNVSIGVPIESRIKTWESIIDKIQRKSLEIERLSELDDLFGVRIILLFQRDLAETKSLLSNTFDIVESEDTSERLRETEFGYRSIHCVVKIPQAWLTVPSLSDLGEFFIDIQVRTMAQHIWAAVSHKLQYKQEDHIPPPVRRSIYRVSALLEIVDLEFERVLKDRESYLHNLKTLDHGNTEVLNVDLLSATYGSQSAKDTKDSIDYSELLNYLKENGITDTGELRRFVQNNSITIDSEIDNNIYTLTVSGSLIIYSIPKLRIKLRELIDKGYTQIIINLSDVNFIDSSALGVFVGQVPYMV